MRPIHTMAQCSSAYPSIVVRFWIVCSFEKSSKARKLAMSTTKWFHSKFALTLTSQRSELYKNNDEGYLCDTISILTVVCTIHTMSHAQTLWSRCIPANTTICCKWFQIEHFDDGNDRQSHIVFGFSGANIQISYGWAQRMPTGDFVLVQFCVCVNENKCWPSAYLYLALSLVICPLTGWHSIAGAGTNFHHRRRYLCVTLYGVVGRTKYSYYYNNVTD